MTAAVEAALEDSGSGKLRDRVGVVAAMASTTPYRDPARLVADGVGARSLKQDYGDINKSLKMAEKSAHIDATLRMAGLSEVFTQDIEDMIHGQNVEAKTQNARPDRVPVPAAAAGAPEKITAAQQRRLEARIAELGLEHERVREWARRASKGVVQQFADLTLAMYEKLDAKLEDWAERAAIQAEGSPP